MNSKSHESVSLMKILLRIEYLENLALSIEHLNRKASNIQVKDLNREESWSKGHATENLGDH